ncbi:MAG: ASKHA domain-containing protein [Candidatus Omnitrophica bacterium]|nr:ASKHA domain-containing protein [Candidatus Omnitrophota bacterium]
MEKFKVTFYPDHKTVEIQKGQSILSAALAAGIYINSNCGGEGICGRCKIILRKGEVFTQPSGRLSWEERKHNYYLACLTTVQSDLEVEVPEESRLSFEKLAVEEIALRFKGFYEKPESIETTQSILDEVFVHSPLATKLYIELPPPNLNDRVSDLERLYREIRKRHEIPIIQTCLTNIRSLGHLLRNSDWKVTVTLGKRDGVVEIVLVEPNNTSLHNYGFAFDIGTTTICGELIDLNNKKILGARAIYNKQTVFGPDVITRIIYGSQADGLEKLHHAVVDGMNEIIQELIQEEKIDLNNVTCVLCAGNPTMIHLLLKIEPTYLRREPYIPVANFIPTIRASETGIKINPRGLLFCLPGVSSYLGGDIVAGVLSCGMYKEEGICLLIDIGTNGEIVLGNRDFLVGCSASAGPAFEGSGVNYGMRASGGAIQKVKILPNADKVEFSTIGNIPARGICGSGYIDILAQMLMTGVIDRSGKIRWEDHPRIKQRELEKEFIIAFKEETNLDSDIVITETDIENLKRAKAAIFAATSVLVKHMNLDLKQIEKVFIAGGFGSYLNIQNAKLIGLLPDLEERRFIFVGNSSLIGASYVLLSHQAMQRAEELAHKITYFELSVDHSYMEEYMAALFFPHTDISRFPNLKGMI